MVGKNLSDSVSANRYYEGWAWAIWKEMGRIRCTDGTFWNQKPYIFEPSVNLATPPNYRLGPRVMSNHWHLGYKARPPSAMTMYLGRVSTIPDLGLIYLNSMTITETSHICVKELNKIYAGLDNGTEPSLTNQGYFAETAGRSVNVMGKCSNQEHMHCLLSLPCFILYRAGGVSDIGNLPIYK